MSRTKALFCGVMAGFVAALAMTVVMLVLAWLGVATPLAIIGDRISVFFSPGPFLSLMGRVGGYNHLKQLGVGSNAAGQLLFGGIGGGIYGLCARRGGRVASHSIWTVVAFIVLPVVVIAIALWPVLGTSYRGLPIAPARLITLVAFGLSVLVFERTLVRAFDYLVRPAEISDEFTPAVGRRAFVLGALGLVLAGGGAAIVRRLYRAATFSYDGTQYKGQVVEGITPNDLFYCVTKNVIDPKVDLSLWHLEINGLVQNPATYRFEHLKDITPIEQETTLMCISNGLDAGLISNARWTGIPLAYLLDPAVPLASATRVRFHAVDNYTDTIPLETAMKETTLLAYKMNGVPLPDRHGYPLRVIVPGYFGEKHVKWLTRVELATDNAKGFYETQGWGPDFITPTRSRIDVPDNQSSFSLGKIGAGVEIRGMAYGGDRGISRVEWSRDDGKSWQDAEVVYSGGKLAWSLWSVRGGWQPNEPGSYTLVVRATDGDGDVQEWEEDRSPFSGATGFHKITVHITA